MVSLSSANNNTVEVYVADRLLNIKNGTLIYFKTQGKYQDNELNELLYVVVVIMFYATALMVLIATQIKRSKREGQEVDYYDEYLQRNSAMYQKKQMQQQMMQRVQEKTGSSVPGATSGPSLTPPQELPHDRGTPNGVNLERILDEEVWSQH